jgi:hypothetical protein
MSKVASLRPLPNVPFGTYGTIVNKYVWLGCRYIVVKFENGIQLEFGDEHHPLISYKGWIKIWDEN